MINMINWYGCSGIVIIFNHKTFLCKRLCRKARVRSDQIFRTVVLIVLNTILKQKTHRWTVAQALW